MPALLASYMEQGAIGLVFSPSIIEREDRGLFNLLVELGAPVHAEILVPPGERGTFTTAEATGPPPPHVRDQMPLYAAFRYRRQPFTAAEL